LRFRNSKNDSTETSFVDAESRTACCGIGDTNSRFNWKGLDFDTGLEPAKINTSGLTVISAT
jgi:hypothetical protein